MSTVLRIGPQSKVETAGPTPVAADDLDPRIALIQAPIPLGLQAVAEVLQQEVQALAGPRYAREDGVPHLVRWGQQRGSVYLADQKLPVQVPRVRNRQAGSEVPLQSYTRLQQPRAADEGVLRRILYGLSCRDYRAAAEAVPEAFGLSRSSVSRRYIRATARQLAALQERRLDRYDVVALVLDGKRFAEDTMVIALGTTLRGEKVLLGFVQTGTENADVCAAFLRRLLERGLRIDEGLLVVLDGGKGLRRAVREVLGDRAHVQRCTWHKRENVVAYLPKHLAIRLAGETAARVSAAHLRGRAERAAAPPRRAAAAQRGRGAEPDRRPRGDPDPPAVGTGRSPGHQPEHHEWARVHPGPGGAARGEGRSLDHQ
jgi:hypothetical protein